ncbi:ABC transporter ATP-binding protein [Paenibacillus arenilitoris]|uniref:ABC transporter ATP-binding protein n=1 Tax=Paenibacillus arenilitoris TaxID=2772299 RepID=UPI001CC22981|nr:ABC transporter ATP-binding protein [Paenibacillus arenilitoris]
MIHLNNVTFRYGIDEEESGPEPTSESGVRGISLSVPAGTCTVLCGRSGSGKSTILRLLSGLAPGFYPGNLAGEVLLGGQSPSLMTPEERTRRIGVIFQDPRSQFFMNVVRDELAFSAENLGIPPEEALERITRQAELLHIAHLLDRKLNDLSSGQKQRVAIAAASILAPALLLLDEPTANLDEPTTQAVIELLGQLKRNGTTLVISEHRLHSLLQIADSFVCMDRGEIARVWTNDEFAKLNYEDVRPFGLRHPDMIHHVSGIGDKECPAGGSAIVGRSLAYRYGRKGEGFEGMDLTLPGGSVTALTGDNGAGKTTLGKILSGLLRQSKGEVTRNDSHLSARVRRSLSYLVMQDADYQLYADSVGNELVLGRRLDEALRTRAYEALDAFGLSELRHRHPASLSGGEKQRVTMAAAYCSDAQLIVLDEPTSGLDGDGVLHVAAWVRKLAQAGKTVVIITHDRILTDLACSHVVTLKKGRGSGSEGGEQTRNSKTARAGGREEGAVGVVRPIIRGKRPDEACTVSGGVFYYR